MAKQEKKEVKKFEFSKIKSDYQQKNQFS